ncbi:hypothetical protein N8I77_000984 [Diaporthe amygdali]|uniref:Uncharacterized protein n=1 Tax=Phomopsis amygdali TaxID=1214568 RepID=A0AAD9W9M4_PHOAM|nr:hypothetical protein N8I77_000984 [Diaporthe amygdali]
MRPDIPRICRSARPFRTKLSSISTSTPALGISGINRRGLADNKTPDASTSTLCIVATHMRGLGWIGLDWTGLYLLRGCTRMYPPCSRAKNNILLTTTFTSPPFPLGPSLRGSCFFPRAHRAPNFDNVGIMHASSYHESHGRVPQTGLTSS